ncbi:MAG: substrate-binding domain-containing protein, partial [Spirochaetales bacterium]|nr:substrate-binding domain-containing protein [Spirochaetales bacterium]
SVIQKRPSLIILAAADYVRLVDSVEQAEALGIPVITLDSGVKSDVPVSFVATDNLEAGIKAGEEMRRLMENHERKKVLIMSHIAETATAIDRERGVRMALGDESIIGTWFCDADEDISYRITTDLLKKHPDLGGIVGLNEMASLGVARAVNDAGRKGDILVVAFDNAVQELSFLEEGVIHATVVQRPYNMGYLSVKAAADYLKGGTVAPLMDTGSVLITKENMFERQYQELLFPVSGIKK